jgi:hypothetical protein
MAEIHKVFYSPPPHGVDAAHKNSNISQAVGAASATKAIGNVEPNEYFVFVSTTACRIRFGLSTLGAAIATDMYVPANQYFRYDLRLAQETHFSVIQETAGGFITGYLANSG